jgi:hypothetical protein
LESTTAVLGKEDEEVRKPTALGEGWREREVSGELNREKKLAGANQRRKEQKQCDGRFLIYCIFHFCANFPNSFLTNFTAVAFFLPTWRYYVFYGSDIYIKINPVSLDFFYCSRFRIFYKISICAHSVPFGRPSTRYSPTRYSSTRYPPKYLIAFSGYI